MTVCIITRPRWWELLRARVVTYLDFLRPEWRKQLPHLRESYGSRYPWVISLGDGQSLPLMRVRRFSRDYGGPRLNHSASLSRFQDRSASMSIAKLRRQWPRWSTSDRLDFAQAGSWLARQSDFAGMLRFIGSVADTMEFEAVATWCGSVLPADEAIELLGSRLRHAPPGQGANSAGALGLIPDGRAIDLLRERLEALRGHADYLMVAPGMNWIAYEACCCIEGLLRQCGPDEVRQAVDELATHPMTEVRDAAKRSQRFAKEGR